MSARAFASRSIIGVRAFGWQIDYRPDGWLPLSVREGRNEYFGRVVKIGRGHLVVGPVRSLGEVRR